MSVRDTTAPLLRPAGVCICAGSSCTLYLLITVDFSFVVVDLLVPADTFVVFNCANIHLEHCDIVVSLKEARTSIVVFFF